MSSVYTVTSGQGPESRPRTQDQDPKFGTALFGRIPKLPRCDAQPVRQIHMGLRTRFKGSPRPAPKLCLRTVQAESSLVWAPSFHTDTGREKGLDCRKLSNEQVMASR